MTTIDQELGYLERPYLQNSYLNGGVVANMGQQMRIIIKDDDAQGQQAEFNININLQFAQVPDFLHILAEITA